MKHSYIDKYSDIDSIIHHWDPRVKIITFIMFVLFVVFTHPESFAAFALYAILIGALILLSKIPFIYIISRVSVIIPFILVVAIFIPFLKKGEVAGGYSFGTFRITITYDGLMVFWNVAVKAFLSVFCVTLLMASTKFPNFLKALEELRLPKLIVMIFSFMYRYIFVFQDELTRMMRAKEARSVGRRRWFHIKALANMIGILFIRAYERGESVYLAMCSRGFDGTIRTMDDFKLTAKDLCFSLIVIALLTGIRIAGESYLS